MVNDMVSFKCKDIGMDCPFEASASNVHELKKKIAEHGRTAHNLKHIDAATWEKMETVMK